MDLTKKKEAQNPIAKASSSPEEDEFWIAFGKSLVSKTINILDDRAKFMITTAASLLSVDFAVLVFTSKIAIMTVSPQFFFAISALLFILSLFPRKYGINPWTPDETKHTYDSMIKHKYYFHIAGFAFFFVALISVAFSSFSIIA
jgi:hypothetical protein